MFNGGKILKQLINKAFIVVLIAFTAFQGVAIPTQVNAALGTTQTILYQGRLTDANRITVDDGNYQMIFKIWNHATNANCATDILYTSGGTCGTPVATAVAVTDGIFSVILGEDTASLPDELFDSAQKDFYLEVTIEGETLSPRRRLTAVPFALQAADSHLLDDKPASDAGGTTAHIVASDINGNIQITGDPQGLTAADAALYINPATPVANGMIFGAANNNTAIFSIDAEGDIIATGTTDLQGNISDSTGTLTIADDANITGATTLNSTLAVTGNTTLSTASTSGLATLNSASVSTTLGVTGATTLDGAVTLGDASADNITVNGTIRGGSPLVFDGTTAGGHTTTFALPDPATANQTITFPDATGTVALTSQIPGTTTLDSAYNAGQSIIVDGSGNLVFNLNNSEDFIVQDAGTPFATFSDSGNLDIDGAFTVTGNTDLQGNVFNSGLPPLTIADDTAITGDLDIDGDITGSPSGLNVTDNFRVINTVEEATVEVQNNTAATSDIMTLSSTSLTSGSIIGINTLAATHTGSQIKFDDGTDESGIYTRGGVANGNIAADTGSMALDTTTGRLYIKTTDTVNTGWLDVSLLGQSIDLTSEITGTLPVANGGTGAVTLNNLITLGTHTTGNYITSLTNGSGIQGADGGSESAALTLSLAALTQDWDQTGAFDLILNNADSQIQILESTGATFYGTLDAGDLSANRTYTLPDATGTLITTGDTDTVTGTMILDGTVDIGDDTNLAAGTNLTLAGDTLNVDDAFLLNTGDTGTGSYTITGDTTIDNIKIDGTTIGHTTDTNLLTFASAQLTVEGDIIPSANNAYDLGTTANRWGSLYVSGSTIHLGTSLADEALFGYDGSQFTVALDGAVPTFSIADNGNISNPTAANLTIADDATITGTSNLKGDITADANLSVGTDIDVAGTANIRTDVVNTTGDFKINDSLKVTHATSLDNTLVVTGESTLNSSLTIADIHEQTSFSLTNNAATTSDIIVISATSLTTGDALQITGNTGTNALNITAGDITLADNQTIGGTLAVTGNTTLSTASTSGLATLNSASVSTTLGVTGATTLDGAVTLGDASADNITVNGTIRGGSPLVFDGTTAGGHTTTFALPDPATADQTITFPDATGTVALTSDITAAAQNLDEVYAQSITDGNLTMEVDNATGLTYNLTTTGDFAIQDNGAEIANFGNNGVIAFTNATNTTGFTVTNNTATTADAIQISATSLTTGDALQITGNTGTNALNITAGDITLADNQTIGGTLAVTGNTTLSTASTSGLATLNSASVSTTLGVTGATTLDGAVALGDASADNITFPGTVTSNILPSTANPNLGSDANRWGSLYVTGSTIHMGPNNSEAGSTEGTITYATANGGNFTIDRAITNNGALTNNGGLQIGGLETDDAISAYYTNTDFGAGTDAGANNRIYTGYLADVTADFNPGGTESHTIAGGVFKASSDSAVAAAVSNSTEVIGSASIATYNGTANLIGNLDIVGSQSIAQDYTAAGKANNTKGVNIIAIGKINDLYGEDIHTIGDATNAYGVNIKNEANTTDTYGINLNLEGDSTTTYGINLENTAGESTDIYGINQTLENPAGTNDMSNLVGERTNITNSAGGTGGNVSIMTGSYSTLENASTGTVSLAAGSIGQVINGDTAAGTITNGLGVYGSVDNKANGIMSDGIGGKFFAENNNTMTNLYGSWARAVLEGGTVSTDAHGSYSNLTVNAGAVTGSAYGLKAEAGNNGGTVSDLYAVYGLSVQNGSDNTFGGYFGASGGAAGKNYAIFTEDGYVHIDQEPGDGSGGAIGSADHMGSGSLYVRNNLEIDGNTYLGDNSGDTINLGGGTSDTLSANTSIIPASTSIDLGTPADRFGSLYVTGSSIHIGATGDEAVMNYNTNKLKLGSQGGFEFDTTSDANPDFSLDTTGALFDYDSDGTAEVSIGTTGSGTLTIDEQKTSQGAAALTAFNPAVGNSDSTANTTINTYQNLDRTAVGGGTAVNKGTYLDLNSTANAGVGATVDNYGIDLDITDTSGAGTTVTNYGIRSLMTSTIAAATNYGIYIGAGTDTTDYAIYTESGRVKIGSGGTADNATTDGTLFVQNGIETDGNLYIDGAGTSTIAGDLSIAGNLGVTTNIQVSGDVYLGENAADNNIRLGDDGGDNIYLLGEINTDIIPDSAGYSLGSGTNSWDELYLASGYLKENAGTWEFDVDKDLSVDFQIENDGSITSGSNATINGNLKNTAHTALASAAISANTTINIQDAYTAATADSNGIKLNTTNFTTSTAGVDYNGISNTITTGDVSASSVVTATNSNIISTNTISGAAFIGYSMDMSPNSAFVANTHYLFSANTTYNSTGTVSDWVGYNTTLNTLSAGTGTGDITHARGFVTDMNTHAAGSTIGTATGADITIQDTNGGAITNVKGIDIAATGATADVKGIEISATNAGDDNFGIDVAATGATDNNIGINISASGATGEDIALYTASGAVVINNVAFPDDTSYSTWDDVGAATSGTLFIKGDTEIFEGALCVGNADCDAATGNTDGTIYALNTTVQGNDLAETYPSTQTLLAGEIVTVSNAGDIHVKRGEETETIIGAVSTEPGLVLGWETEEDNFYPIALTGRAPILISEENGPIQIGDRIAQSPTPGVGMKATEPGEVVGIAMQASQADSNTVMAFIQPHYWNGAPEEESITGNEPSSEIETNNVLQVNQNSITNIGNLEGYNWSVSSDGIFKTEGAYQVEIDGHQGNKVTTHAVLGMENYITLAGTTEMNGAPMATIQFETINPEFNDAIESGAPIFVTATPSGGTGSVYITEKSMNGFKINMPEGTATSVDWIVMAYRINQPPEAPPAEEPPVEEPQPEAPPAAEAPQPEEPPAEAPLAEEPPVEEPQPEAPPAEAPQPEAPPAEAPPVEAPQPEAPPAAEAPQPEEPTAEAPPAEAPPEEAQ